MATTLTRNLKLRLNSNLTADAKYNLERLDLLGSTFLTDSTDALNIRSRSDINITPDSADLGGNSTGGSLNIGSSSHSLESVSIYTDALDLSAALGLKDQATGGTKYLRLQYKSDILGSLDTAADRILSIDLQGADRTVAMEGNLSILGGSLTLSTVAGSSVTVPATGTLATLAGLETLTNKTFDADLNFLSNVRNSNIHAAAGIVYSKLNLAGSIVNADVSPSAAIQYSKLLLTGSIVDADIHASAAIARSKLAAGTPNWVVYNSAGGGFTEEQHLSPSRGGFGFDATGLSFPSSGAVVTTTATQTLTNKTLSGASNTFTGVQYASLVLTGSIVNSDIASGAAIAYSKLDLAGQLVNADISASASIARSKLALGAPDSVVINSGTGALSSEPFLDIVRGGTGADTAEDALNNLLPDQTGQAGKVLQTDGSSATWEAIAGSGTVTSVALAMPASIFDVAGSPVTSSGTLAVTLDTQSANLVFAGPNTGSPAAPTFRSLVVADIPSGIDHGGLSGLADDDHTQYHTDARALTWLGTRSTSDLPEGSNLYFTDERAQDAVGGALTDTASIDFTYNDGAGTISAAVLPAGVNHDQLANFVANEHVDHSSVQIATSSTSGLAGGGDITTTRNITVAPHLANIVSPASGDYLLLADVSNSNVLIRTTLQDIFNLDLAGGKFTETWASGDGATKSVTHSFGTADVSVNVYDIDSGEEIMVDSIIRATVNQVDLTASEAPTGSGWRVVVRK